MKNGIPLNRWTVAIAVVLTVFFGGDVVAPFLKAIGIMAAPYVPAM